MRNRRPIFLNAFGAGGSNILVNMILSHPEVCLTAGEMHKMFKSRTHPGVGRTKWGKRWLHDYPVRLLAGQDVFNPRVLEPRRSLPRTAQKYVDWIFYTGRFQAKLETHNLYKHENVEYTVEELAQCRLLSKGLDGIVFATRFLSEMYPDATFFGLVRNGLALCEGRTRRGRSAEEFGRIFKTVVDEMLQLDRDIPNYHIVRYEEILRDPAEFLRHIYKLADLDIEKVKKVRLQSKPILGPDGVHKLMKGRDRQVYWYNIDELFQHIRRDVNENQIRMLKPEDKKAFLAIAGETMEQLSYRID